MPSHTRHTPRLATKPGAPSSATASSSPKAGVPRPERTWVRTISLAATLLLAATLSAQKDGIIARMPGEPPPLAPSGIPATVRITPGTFRMGADAATLPAAITKGFGVMSTRPSHGDFDELPAHTVRLTHAFAIGITQVSPAEFAQFDPTYKPHAATPAYASGSHLGAGHGLLPLAYARRPASPGACPPKPSGSTSLAPAATEIFGASDTPVALDQPNAFGVENMGVGRPEWTLDNYGPYQPGDITDPTGASSSMTKAIRGGGLDWRHTATKTSPDLNVPATAPYFSRPANRASLPPSYASENGNVGFRVVQAPDPTEQLHSPAVLLLRDRCTPADHHRRTRSLQTRRPPRYARALLPHARAIPQPRWQEHARRRLASRPRARPRHQLSQLRNPGSPQRRPPGRLLQHARSRGRPRPDRHGPPPPRRHRRLGHARALPPLRRRRPRRTRHLERSQIPISTRWPPLVVLGIRPPHRRSALRLRHFE